MAALNEDRCWTKQELAEWLGVKVSYVEAKAATKAWPSLLFHELRFGPDERREILTLHRRDAEEQPAALEREPRPRAPRIAAPPVQTTSNGRAPLVARTPERRRKRPPE